MFGIMKLNSDKRGFTGQDKFGWYVATQKSGPYNDTF